MPTNRYFFDEGTLTLEIDSTELVAAEARNITIEAEAEHVRFFGPDSILQQDVKRREAGVPVDIEIAEFDEQIAQYWLGGDGTTSSSFNDSSHVAQFDLTVEQNMTDHTGETGDESLKAVVTDVDFPSIPLVDGTEGEYLAHNFSGQGVDVTYTKETES